MGGENTRIYSSATAEIVQYLNVENAKICAFVMVIGFAVYHGLIHARYGGDSCDWLLSEGRFQGDNIWQPYGCMVHKYTTSEVRNCMHYISYWGGKNHIVFIGDSRIRQQYQEFVSLVTGVEKPITRPHQDDLYKDDNINLEVEFLWEPVVNESMEHQYEKWLNKKEPPSVIVTGSGTWSMKLYNGSSEGTEDYKLNLSSLYDVMTKFENTSKILWMLQEPVDATKSRNYSRSFLTNKQVDAYNAAVIDILEDSTVNIWSSSKKIAEGFPHDSKDGLHHGKLVLSWDSQVLVNLYCNDHMNFDDGTCCSSREPVTSLQIVTASFFGACLFLSLCMFLWKRKKDKVSVNNHFNIQAPYTNSEIERLVSPHKHSSNNTSSDLSPVIAHVSNKTGDEYTDRSGSEFHEEFTDDLEDSPHHVHEKDVNNLYKDNCDDFQPDGGLVHDSNHSNSPKGSGSHCYSRINGTSNNGVGSVQLKQPLNEKLKTKVLNYQFKTSNCHQYQDKVSEIGKRTSGLCTGAIISNLDKGEGVGCLDKPEQESGGCYELMVSLGRLGIIMMYFFLCDRTSFFMKENKYYTHVNFFLPFSYLMIVGFFFTEKSQFTTVLHRDQTDEWKGWMQLVILIYHMTGASRVLSIYMQIRVLVSSYLFLSGFGHFYYFFVKGDFSLHRFCTVMFRFNFLVVLLCFTMNRPYQFYYFVPLVSVWFLIMYVTMGIWPQVTAMSADVYSLHYLYIILKFAVLVMAITLLYASEVLFEDIFLSHPLKALFVTSDDSIHEWRFRWKIDRYSTVFGMAFAFALVVSKKLKVVADSKAEALFSRGLSWLVGVLAAAGLAGYFIFANLCRNKEECNEVHGYISFLPIVSFIVLRNLPGWLRVKYSSFFAWFGRIALELFISQYHMWLASDTHGILVLVPSYPVLNLTVTSFIFVCAAHEIHTVTGTLVQYFVPNNWKSLLRNIILFFIVLLPVAITRGAFG